ncbi:MAG: NAD-dependent epimerase/dehydratase family protein [Terrimicrobiaceae bacterium]
MNKVAILGGSGFIGAKLSDVFEFNNFEVVLFERDITKKSSRKLCKVDLFDSDSLEKALKNEKPDLVISTAWDTAPGNFWTSEINVKFRDATINFAEMSFRADVSTFIGLGTVSEYGISPGICDASKTLLVESDIYSKSKIQTGNSLHELGMKYGTKTHWARVFQAFGPNEKVQRYIPGLMANLSQGNRFFVKTPHYVLDWIHTEDIASAIFFGYLNKLGHFLDVGTGIGTSVSEFSTILCRELSFDPDLLDFSQAIPDHHKIAVVDKSSQILANGWKPQLQLSDRIRSLV